MARQLDAIAPNVSDRNTLVEIEIDDREASALVQYTEFWADVADVAEWEKVHVTVEHIFAELNKYGYVDWGGYSQI